MPKLFAKNEKKASQKRRARKREATRVTHGDMLRKTTKRLKRGTKQRFNDYYFFPQKALREIINTYVGALVEQLAEGNEVSINKLGKIRIEVQEAVPKGTGGTSGKQGKYDARMHAIAVDSLKKKAKAIHDLKKSEEKWATESKKYRSKPTKKSNPEKQ